MLRLIKNILGKTIKFIYRITYKLIPTHKKTVLFIAFHGRGYSDNPRAIYEYMRQQDQFKDYRFIWAIKHHKKKNISIENAKVIEYFSIPYFFYLARSQYWIANCKLPMYVLKKKNQIYLQTWHGTPLKKLAFDDVISGDLSPLFESESLESVSMESKKKYGYSEGEVNKMLIRNKDCDKTDKIQKRKVAYFGKIDIKPSEEEIDCEVILDKKKIYLALNLFDGVPEYDWLNEYEDYASNLLQYKKAIDDYIVRDYDSNGKAKEYIDFHVEELDKSSINKILKKTESDTTIEKRLLSVLKLERVGFYPGDDDYAVWDYTIGKNVTDRLIVVVTDNNGNIKEITTES